MIPAHTTPTTAYQDIAILIAGAREQQRHGWHVTARSLIEQAQNAIERAADPRQTCDAGHPLDAHGHCPACLEQAEQLAYTREHVGWTEIQRDKDIPF